MQIPYVKMHGARNDYVYINLLSFKAPGLEQMPWADLAKLVSDRQRGIGADGLILVGPPSQSGADAAMVMFNADGSVGKMCGNGIRCVSKILDETLGPKESFKISTLSGVKECFMMERLSPEKAVVRVNMGRPTFLPDKIPVLFEDVMVMHEEFEVADRTFKISCVSMGNPHCVIEVENLESFPVEKYGPLIEKHEAFPEGVNVEFIEIKNGKVYQRTWERGSGETMACGTGACAVGVVLIMGRLMKSPVQINLRGGSLTVEWDGLREVYLTGEAVTESRGTIDTEKFGLTATA
jgi:diaminopimelate epimerase